MDSLADRFEKWSYGECEIPLSEKVLGFGICLCVPITGWIMGVMIIGSRMSLGKHG